MTQLAIPTRVVVGAVVPGLPGRRRRCGSATSSSPSPGARSARPRRCREALAGTAPGQSVTVTYRRDGQEQTRGRRAGREPGPRPGPARRAADRRAAGRRHPDQPRRHRGPVGRADVRARRRRQALARRPHRRPVRRRHRRDRRRPATSRPSAASRSRCGPPATPGPPCSSSPTRTAPRPRPPRPQGLQLVRVAGLGDAVTAAGGLDGGAAPRLLSRCYGADRHSSRLPISARPTGTPHAVRRVGTAGCGPRRRVGAASRRPRTRSPRTLERVPWPCGPRWEPRR